MIRVLVKWDGNDTTVAVDPPDTPQETILALLLGGEKQVKRKVDEAKSVQIVNSWLAYFKNWR